MDTIHQLRDKVEHLYNKASQETLEELQTSDLFADNQRFKDILTETLSTEARTLEEKNKKLANILELRKIVQNGYKTTDTEKDRYFLIDTALENVAYTEFASATELVKTVEDKTKVAMFIYLGMELSKLNGIDNIVIDTLINEAKKELERIEQDDASNEKILARLRKLFLRYSDEAIVVSKIFEDNLAELLGNYTGKLDLRNMAAANKNNDFDIFSDQNSDEDGTEKRKKTEEGLSLVRKTNIYHLVQELMPQVVAFPEYKRKSIGELRKELGY
jgi:hypothetical protein